MAAPSSYVKTNTMGFLTVVDGLGTSLTVPFDKGDVAISGLAHRLNELVKTEARGRFISAAYGGRRYPTFNFSAFLTNFLGASTSPPGSLLEFITGKGAYSANQSTLGANRPMAVHITLTIEGSVFGDAADETVQAKDVHFVADFAEAVDGNTVSLAGDVMGDVVITNSGNVVTYSQITSASIP